MKFSNGFGMRLLRRGICLGSILILGACASTNIDLSGYRPVPMENADIMPTPEQAQGRRTKVVLLDMDDKAVRSRMADAGTLKQRKLEDVLGGGGVEVIDRELAGRLRQEIALAEVRGDGKTNYTGPELAQYAIRGAVSDVGASSSFTAASQSCDKKGKCYNSPASCTYSGSASGSIRIYELPSLKLVSTINLKGSSSTSTEGGCYGNQGLLTSVARSALEDAVHNNRIDIQNFFAPKGYVAEKRMQEKKVVVKVQIGRLNGVKPNDRIVFYSLQEAENRLTRKVERNEVVLTTGVASDQIADDFAWVILDSSDKPDGIRMGDYARVQNKKGWF